MSDESRTRQVEAELRALKRGAGAVAADVDPGPLLRRACRVTPRESAESVRTRLQLLLRRHARALPEPEGSAVLAAYGLHPEAQFRFLKERERWILRNLLDRDAVRTADRVVNKAIAGLAQHIERELAEADRPNRYVPTGFWTRSLEATVRLDLPVPEWTERRTVVVTTPGLDRVPVGSTVPRVPDPTSAVVELRVVDGGELQDWSLAAPAYYAGTVALPRPLDVGEEHDYEIVYRFLPPGWVQPHYLLTPHLHCEQLAVRVRFGTTGTPPRAWLLDGVPRGSVDDPPGLSAPVLSPDSQGWVFGAFTDLYPGLTYGIRWEPDP